MQDNFSKQYLYFNKDVESVQTNKTLVKAGSVHYCEGFEFEEIYSDRYERSTYHAWFYLAGGVEIKLCSFESEADLLKDIERMATTVSEMKVAYDYYGRHKQSLAVDPITPFK